MKNFSVEDILKEVFIGKRIKETEFIENNEEERAYYEDINKDFPSFGKVVKDCIVSFDGEDPVLSVTFEDDRDFEFYTNDTFIFMEGEDG